VTSYNVPPPYQGSGCPAAARAAKASTFSRNMKRWTDGSSAAERSAPRRHRWRVWDLAYLAALVVPA
jgi:hypothetical protein